MTNKTYKIIGTNNNLEKEIDNTHIIMMFLKQCEREQGLPFVATMEVPNNRLLVALKESEDIINGKVEAKRYKSFDDLLKDVD